RTALHEFSTRSLPRLVAYLLRHGAQPNISALNGDTALHEAAKTGNVRIVRTLLRHNADPLVLNSRGERPVDVCENSETLAILNQVTTGISAISALCVLALHASFLTIEFSALPFVFSLLIGHHLHLSIYNDFFLKS
ncbi:hypothetical protein AHF37_08895, partial [Paragonimus kellicotti]